jgi:hypothetical protein
MGATRNAKRPDGARPVDGETRRRLAIEAAMLAFLIGIALAFVASAPS